VAQPGCANTLEILVYPQIDGLVSCLETISRISVLSAKVVSNLIPGNNEAIPVILAVSMLLPVGNKTARFPPYNYFAKNYSYVSWKLIE
jgi:hypothetical protein